MQRRTGAGTGMPTMAAALVGLAILFTSLAPPVSAQTPADPTLREAVDVYQSGQFDRARQMLEARSDQGLTGRDRAIRDLYRAMALFGLGREAEARTLMMVAAEADFSVRLDPLVHAPSRVETYEEIRSGVAARSRVVEVRFTSAPSEIREGTETRIAVTSISGVGAELGGERPVTWSVSDETVLTVSADGTATARAPGVAVITASVEGVEAEHRLTVLPGVRSLDVGSPLTITAGDDSPLGTRALSADGEVVDVEMTFESDDPRIATVTADGVVRGVTQGSTSIRVTAEGLTESVPVEVTRRAVSSVAISPTRSVLELGASIDLSVRTMGSDGTVLRDRPVAWSSSDDGAAPVTTSGHVLGARAGLVVISATSEGASGQAQIRVLPRTGSATTTFITGLVVPGGGQFQVGRPVRGTLTLAGAAGAIAWGLIGSETKQYCISPVQAGGSCPPEDVLREETSRPNLIPGVAVGVGLAVLSAIDAARYRTNQNREAERLRAQPWADGTGPALGIGPDGAVQASWRIHAR